MENWIPTYIDQNLPSPGKIVAVIHHLATFSQYRFRKFGHVLSDSNDLYWRIHDDPPGVVTQLKCVTHWYPIPEMPES